VRGLLDAVHGFLKSRYFYPVVFLGCLTPGLILAWKVYAGALGVNPVETLLHQTGRAALGVLLLTLAITPIRRIFGWNRVQVVRRMMGLWAFFYALCHFSTYVVFDQVGDVAAIAEDVFKRKFIFSGMLALAILLVLAVTSTNGMMRRLGRNWTRLHRLVYVGAMAAAIHFVWGQKSDISEPLTWAGFLAIVLGLRVFFSLRTRIAKRRRPVTA
jgi:methionine sulfoxide reductase heme-binding subunit